MTEITPQSKWSILNDVTVIEAMLTDANSPHWNTCNTYIQYVITSKFPNLLPETQKDAIQEAMISVHRKLPAFRRDCKFTSWLNKVARSRALDEVRRHQGIQKWEIYPEVLIENPEDDDPERFMKSNTRTPEEIALTLELLQETYAAIEKFLTLHSRKQNREILRMVLEDSNSYEQTAQILGVPAPNIGYLIRLIREYLKQEVLHSPDKNE